MHLRLANSSDIPQIIELERLPQSRQFIGQWSEERHRATLASPDARYYLADGADDRLDAYIILRGFAESNHAVELKRVAVRTPGNGVGKAILEELLRIVFVEHSAHRLFLDVFESNARARHVYERLGFVYEGRLRDAAFVDGEYHSLLLMSLLEPEYATRRERNPASLS